MGNAGFSKFRSKWWALCEIERQIRNGRSCTAASLAQDIEVNTRTLRRYLAFMREELDAPIEYDPIDGRYKLTETRWTMPNVSVSDEEMLSLVVAIRSMSSITPEPFSKSLLKLQDKLLAALPENRREELLELQAQIDVIPASITSTGNEWITPIVAGIRDRQTLSMIYYAYSKRQTTGREVDPYYLRFFAGTWYLVGYDHRTRHFPIFSLARIKKLTATDAVFKRRPFSAADYFKHSFGISVGSKVREVRIRLTGRAAATASEKRWPPGFLYSPQDDGSGLLVGRVSQMDDVLVWVASTGGEASILS